MSWPMIRMLADSWFGSTPGPYQHFQQARVRAVETGLPLIRDANSGISAVVDARGEIVAGLKLDEMGFIDATLDGLQKNTGSPYPRQTYFWLTETLLMAIALISRRGFISRLN